MMSAPAWDRGESSTVPGISRGKIEEPVQERRPPNDASLPAPSGLRILVADDHQDAVHMLAMLLKALGNEVRTAQDGLEAIDVAAEFRPAVVLMDIGMPKLDGCDAARRIREQPWGAEMMLVALTGWGQEEDKQHTKEAGFDYHLVKPVESTALQKLLVDWTRPVGSMPT